MSWFEGGIGRDNGMIYAVSIADRDFIPVQVRHLSGT